MSRWARAISLLCAVAITSGLAPISPISDPAYADEAPELAEIVGFDPATDQIDQIIVVYENGLEMAETESKAIESLDSNDSPDLITDENGTVNAAVLDIDEEVGLSETVQQIQSLSGVSWIQPNFKYSLSESASGSDTPASYETYAFNTNDPQISDQYYLDDWENGHGANVRNAWDEARCEGNVTIAVLDTGIRVDHEDLGDNIVSDYMRDIYSDTDPGTITSRGCKYGDNNGHGTHVSGIAAAAANNEIGIAGASYNAKILPLKVFDNNTMKPSCETKDLISAYNYLFSLANRNLVDGLHLANMSLGSYGSPDRYDRLLEEMIERAKDDYDILTVVAGGNGALQEPNYPSDFEACMSVTALDKTGSNASFSDYNEYKDISAPGVDIYSTYNRGASSYAKSDGTSMASPLVAACASLLWAVCPTLKVDEAKEAIYETARSLDADSPNYHPPADTGSHGAIDAAAAVNYVKEHYSVLDRVSMADCKIAPIEDQFYMGYAITPSNITVTHDGESLVQGTDYRLVFSNNIEPGTASVLAIGLGRFSGYISSHFKICQNISEAFVSTDSSAYAYTGTPIEPNVTVSYKGSTLKEGRDYAISFSDNVEVGMARAIVTGTGDFLGTVTKSFEIRRFGISNAVIRPIADQTYTGSPIAPSITVTMNDVELVPGRDYESRFTNNTNAGTATVSIIGNGDYAESKSSTFKIAPAQITDASLATSSYKYTGSYIVPQLAFVKSGANWLYSSDYDASYSNNKNIGMGTVTVSGKGNYTGTIYKTFSINATEGSTFTVGKLRYKVSKKNAELAAIGSTRKTGSISVPATTMIGGKSFKVTSISNKAFYGKGFKSISIGKNVKKIGKYAFAKCAKLKSLKLASKSITSFGRYMVKGSYKKLKVKVPSVKLRLYRGKIAKTGAFRSTMKVVRG